MPFARRMAMSHLVKQTTYVVYTPWHDLSHRLARQQPIEV